MWNTVNWLCLILCLHFTFGKPGERYTLVINRAVADGITAEIITDPGNQAGQLMIVTTTSMTLETIQALMESGYNSIELLDDFTDTEATADIYTIVTPKIVIPAGGSHIVLSYTDLEFARKAS